MKGARSVTSAELDAHLHPMRQDIRDIGRKMEEFAEFMTGAIVSREIQERVIKSRQFWLGVAISASMLLIAAIGVIINLSGRVK